MCMELTHNVQERRLLKSGFTLIELMIVITIIGLLMYFAIPRLAGVLDRARVRTSRLMIQTLKNAISLYKLDVGDNPEKLRDLIKKPSEERAAKKWEGPYFADKEIPSDPWGNPYRYEKTATGYDLYSYGPKGKDAPKDEYIRAD
jgi:general secretion pathway protein G